MKTVRVERPSFPESVKNQLLSAEPNARWQVLAGDSEHWRVGVYSPAETDLDAIEELEKHDCPELFLLTSGRLHLVLAVDGALQTVALEPGRPIVVTAPHSGYCPDGPHGGTALVIERDAFSTEYRSVSAWLEASAQG